MRPGSFLFVLGAVLALVPGWTGDERLPLLGERAVVIARRVALDPADPARRRVGRLLFLGGVSLSSPDPAFGGFSALAVQGNRVTLLSDGGNVVQLTQHADGQVSHVRFGALPSGPGTGWRKQDRDSESMALDPATGAIWVGFERANAIWRYAPGFARATAHAAPAVMRSWRPNGGAEALVRLHDGRFVALQETAAGPTRTGLVWAGDPTGAPPALAFRYRPPAGFDPSDAAELPDGRLLVLNRAWAFPLRFRSALTLLDPRRLRPGADVTGMPIAELTAPLLNGNFEGVATTREHGHTAVWLVSDNDGSWLRPTLLLKFRLD